MAACLLSALLVPSALAQMPGILIQDATILTGDGQTLEKGSILVSGDSIAAVGPGIAGGMMATRVPADGKFVTPGLIDSWSALALRDGGGEPRASALGLDNFDRYDSDAIRAALRQGVTMVFVPASGREGINGLGAIVRLAPVGSDAEEHQLVKKEAGVCAALGTSGQGVLSRVRAAAELDKQFREAKEYREALDAYEDDLKEYEEKLKKRVAEAAKQEAESKKEEKGEKSGKSEKKDKAAVPEEPANADAAAPPRRRRPNPRPQPAAESKAEGDKKKDELQKPKKPDRDVNKETLLRLMDGELRLFVQVERPEDILNVLEIGAKYNLPLALEGASGAAAVAGALSEAEIPVVLGLPRQSLLFDGGPRRFARVDDARRLHDAGVTVVLSSGGAGATANLAMTAAQAVGQGLPEDAALAGITSAAARVLGIDKDYGRIARGRAADLVLWSHHPFDPRARVEAVYIAGQEVYRASEESQEE